MKRIINSFLLTQGSNFNFIQGMSVISTFLLFYMGEVEAFYCFDRLITKVFPTYFNPGSEKSKGMEGAYAACELVDFFMSSEDPELFDVLKQYKIPAKSWAFPRKFFNHTTLLFPY